MFKVGANDKSLDKFDATIDMLDAFEDIRYPDEIIAKGATLQIDIRKATAVIPQFAGGYNPPHYMFSLEEIDELVAAIFKVASRNPSAPLVANLSVYPSVRRASASNWCTAGSSSIMRMLPLEVR